MPSLNYNADSLFLADSDSTYVLTNLVPPQSVIVLLLSLVLKATLDAKTILVLLTVPTSSRTPQFNSPREEEEFFNLHPIPLFIQVSAKTVPKSFVPEENVPVRSSCVQPSKAVPWEP